MEQKIPLTAFLFSLDIFPAKTPKRILHVHVHSVADFKHFSDLLLNFTYPSTQSNLSHHPVTRENVKLALNPLCNNQPSLFYRDILTKS